MRKPKTPIVPEKDVVRDCLAFLNTQPGVWAWRNNTGAVVSSYKGKTRMIRYGAKGAPDILGIGQKGRLLAVECKRQGKQASEDQEAFLRQIRAKGGFAVWVHSLDELVEAWEAES